MRAVTIHIGDVLDGLAKISAGSVHCCVTSPPYWGLRDYGVDGQIGLEKTPDEFIARMVEVFAEVRRVLRDDGTLWLNLGDSYATGTTASRMQSTNAGVGNNTPEAQNSVPRCGTPDGLKTKDLCMIPWRVALALQADGWWLRSVICWAKKSPMPESVTDRPTSSWEPIFLMAKSERYFYDAEAVKEASSTGAWDAMPPIGGVKHAGSNGNATYSGDQPANNGTRNQRNVWHLGPEPYREAHFATFPTEIPRRAIKAGTSEKGCCAACGAPWVRVMKRSGVVDGTARGSRFDKGKTADRTGGQRTQSGERMLAVAAGWEPGCTCGGTFEWVDVEHDDFTGVVTRGRERRYIGGADSPVPCVVLDPFLGSGTTVAVARELGRHGVGCELNPEYAALARERIGKAERPATFRSEKAIDSPLFTESNP